MFIAWGDRLHAFRTADGKRLPVRADVRANQVVLSSDGKSLLAAHRSESGSELFAVRPGGRGGSVLWNAWQVQSFAQVAGFLPDGKRFVAVDDEVRIRSIATSTDLTVGRYKAVGTQQPRISPDGRNLGLIGYGKMYFWDLTTLARPRRIGGTSSFGDFRSLAFHPDGKTVAVIHGGPTLVKVYNLDTLKLVHQWTWKLGRLGSVAYSPDGTLGTAGSDGWSQHPTAADEQTARTVVTS